MSHVDAADLVRWSELPRKISHTKFGRQYKIVTKTGTTYVDNDIRFDDAGVYLNGVWIPRKQVAEVRINRHGPLSDALRAPTDAILGPMFRSDVPASVPDGFTILPLVILTLGATVVATPVILPIEGFKRLLPDKVIKVAP